MTDTERTPTVFPAIVDGIQIDNRNQYTLFRAKGITQLAEMDSADARALTLRIRAADARATVRRSETKHLNAFQLFHARMSA